MVRSKRGNRQKTAVAVAEAEAQLPPPTVPQREIEEMDDSEAELERAVFGDSLGFRDRVRDFGLTRMGDDEGSDDGLGGEARDDDGMGALADADLFFTDSGFVAPADSQALVVSGDADEHDDDRDVNAAAWQDSDDERITVSLASVPRLRKLRKTEGEDYVSGREYIRRLRKQFELLHPVPDWAVEASKKRKRQGTMTKSNGDDYEDEDDMDVDIDDDEDDDEDDGDNLSTEPLSKLLQDVDGLVRRESKKRKLRPETLDIQRTKDVPGVQPSAITSLSFHPKLPLLLSSGPASTLYLHHIVSSPPAPEANPLLTSLHIRKTPLTTSAFHPTDSRVFLSARRRFFHVWNLDTGRVEKVTRVYGQQHEQRSMESFKLSPDGRFMALMGTAKKGGGFVNILDARTLQWTTQFRVDGRGGVADFAWWRDGRGVVVAAKNGEISEFDVDAGQLVARWRDEGAVGTTTIALGGDVGDSTSPIGRDRWVAVGSSSGIVNIYDRRAWLHSGGEGASVGVVAVPEAPKPTRVMDNLTTPTSHLVFSPDGQMLAVASRWKKDALRIVHLPSCTVFKNWPTANTPLGRITGVAFAPGSDGLAVANEQGKIRLWEIRA